MRRRFLKHLLTYRWCGRVIGRIFPQAGFRILTFHRVLPNDTPPDDYRRILGNPTAAEFERLVVCLKKRFRIRPLPELVEAAPRWGNEFALGISFDDGYADVAAIAAPILFRHGVPFTVFLTTAFMDGEVPWFSRLFAFVHGAEVDRGALWLPASVAWDGRSPSELRDRLSRHLNRFDTPRMHEMLDELEARNPWYRPPADLSEFEAFMTWDDVRTMQRAPLVTWGSHTVTHINVASVDGARLREELECSRDRIERETGRPCDLIAYPGGRFDESKIRHVRAAGYRAGFVMREGINNCATQPYAFRREYAPCDLAGALFRIHGLRQRLRGQRR